MDRRAFLSGLLGASVAASVAKAYDVDGLGGLADNWLKSGRYPDCLPDDCGPKRPNVIFILADDLGYSDLGCYGGELPTQRIDSLAENGLRYSAFYTSARCCPSRASLMTGLHPHQAGIPAMSGNLKATSVTMAEVLKSAGYSTWMVGKWHMGTPGPIERGFDQFYGYVNGHSQNQWDPGRYTRLGAEPELSYDQDQFYATDVFTDYALEFISQARQQQDKPWMLYLAHSSPHFPIHAPKESIDRHMETYRQGWDVLRQQRFERMKNLGLVPADAQLPDREIVPVDDVDVANGYPGQPNPAWDDLSAERREDLARRMATYAAMVEHVDKGIGRIVDDLKEHGELDNTIIFFASDNGACYEWGPYGFDGASRAGTNVLHVGDELDQIGQPGTHQSYGSAWANLGNTPLRLYKHFCHEGGLRSPLVVHWPAGIRRKGELVDEPAALFDIMPTLCEITDTAYPLEFNGNQIDPAVGVSLAPTFHGRALAERTLPFEHQQARGLRRGDWKISWGKRMPDEPKWELYNLAEDMSEQNDLAEQYPQLTQELADQWSSWASRMDII